jgi:hypothetical protein
VTGSPSRTRQRSEDDSAENQSTIYCIVPPELSKLWEPLYSHFADDPNVQVVIEQRRSERRSREDRRGMVSRGTPARVERRLASGLEGRRFSERRATPIPVEERPALSPELYCYADELSFVRRLEDSTLHWDLARLRALAGEWRDRCRDAEREVTGLLGALVWVADDLGKLRSWSPRRFMALHRARETIDCYRQTHLDDAQMVGSNEGPSPGSNGAAPGSSATQAPIRSYSSPSGASPAAASIANQASRRSTRSP